MEYDSPNNLSIKKVIWVEKCDNQNMDKVYKYEISRTIRFKCQLSLKKLNLKVRQCTYILWDLGHHLSHRGQVTHICTGKLTIIGSDNGLLPGQYQAIIWTNAGTFLIRPLGTNFREILTEIYTLSLKQIQLFCVSLNALTGWIMAYHQQNITEWYSIENQSNVFIGYF